MNEERATVWSKHAAALKMGDDLIFIADHDNTREVVSKSLMDAESRDLTKNRRRIPFPSTRPTATARRVKDLG